jgi:phage tail sheath gpL-like
MAVVGQVFELSPTDKLPGVALKTVFGVGGNLANQLKYLLIVGSKASSGGTLTEDTDVFDVLADGDEATFYGDAGAEGARMVSMAKRIPGLQIKCCAPLITGGVAATNQIVIDGSWSVASSGPIRFRIGGQVVEVSALASDDPESFATAIAAAINAKAEFPVTAAAAAGTGTDWIVTLTAKSLGARGNDLILWKYDTYKPSGMTITIGGAVGATVASDAGPWPLAHSDTVVVAFNAGGDQTFTLSAVAAAVETTNSSATPFNLDDGMVLNVKIDGQATAQAITFAASSFVDVNAATPTEIAAVINAQLIGGRATVTSGGTKVTLTSDTKGTGSHVQVTGGTANAAGALNFSTTEADGTGNVADVSAVTAAEWVTIMTALTNGTVEDSSGALLFTSTTTGGSGTVQVKAASTADDEMGFDNAVHSGSAGGTAVASGGKRFTGGAGTEDLTDLLATLAVERYWTVALASRDATNLARFEAATDTKAGPLVRLFENVVTATTGTYAASTSLAQTTLDDVRYQMLWMEEGETPAEEMAAWMAAVRHQREVVNPNTKYDGMVTPFVPQEAPSKRPNRATQVAALDVGLTVVPTRNSAAYIARAITTRTLTDAGAADDGTIDVGQARTPDEVNEIIGADWLAYTDAEDTTAHHYLRNDPAEGEEADVPAGTTYPAAWQKQVTRRLKQLEAAPYGWITEVDANPTVVNMHPTASSPRFVQYTPIVVTPLTHQLEGTIAQKKFTPS